MSLFPSEHLSVAITPTAIALIAYRGRWRPKQYDTQEVRFDEGGLDNALAGLAHILNARGKPGSTVRFSISNAFVRAAALPWSDGKLSVEEETVLARQRFSELYGEMNDWQIQLNCERQYGQPCLAFAMPGRFVEGLMALSQQYGLDCRGIVPSAVHCWNRYGKNVLGSSLLFLAIESGYGLLFSTRGLGKLRVPVSARMAVLPNNASEIQAVLHREILLQGLDEETQCFCEAFGVIPQSALEPVHVAPIFGKASVAMAMATAGWAS